MSREPDHYAVLGVAVGSQDVVIEAAYQALIQKYDAAVHRSVNAAKKRADIKAAYAVIGNGKSRADYDRRRGITPAGTIATPNDRREQATTASVPAAKRLRSGAQPAKSLTAAGNRSRVHPAVWIGGGALAVWIIASALGTASTNTVTNGTLNVDENLTTTDMNASTGTNLNAVDANTSPAATSDENAVQAEPAGPNLSQLAPSAVAYAAIDGAANWFTNVLKNGGFDAAQTSSEQCHRAVQAHPSWSGADRCAAFDFAAAYIDDVAARGDRTSTHAYFQFARQNQAVNYTSIGAMPHLLDNRLVEIKRAAEGAVVTAINAAAARDTTTQDRDVPPTQAPQPPPTAAADQPRQYQQGATQRVRAVPEGVFLNSETNLNNGTKRCRFSNGFERVVSITGDCFYL